MRILNPIVGAALVAALSAGAARAQALPPARELADRYVAAVGGADAVRASVRQRARGTMEIPAAGLKGTTETIVTAPRILTRIELAGVGTIVTGYDGVNAWSVDPMSGARLVTGDELRDLADMVDPRVAVYDPAAIRSMQTVHDTTFGAERCFVVRTVWTSGRQTDDCFSAATGLIAGTRRVQQSPNGAITLTSTYSDYREFNGVKVPTRMVQEAMGQRYVTVVESVEPAPQGDAWFTIPAQVQPLIAARAGQR